MEQPNTPVARVPVKFVARTEETPRKGKQGKNADRVAPPKNKAKYDKEERALLKAAKKKEKQAMKEAQRLKQIEFENNNPTPNTAIKLTDEEIIYNLAKLNIITNTQNPCSIKIKDLKKHYNALKLIPNLPADVLPKIRKTYDYELAQIEDTLNKNLIKFNDLWYYYYIGVECYGLNDMHCAYQGFTVTRAREVEAIGGSFYEITGKIISTNGRKINNAVVTYRIPRNDVFINIENLPVKHITPEIKQKLQTRGEKFKQVCLNANFKHYQGLLYVPNWGGYLEYHCDGRVMIDPYSANKLGKNPTDYFRNDGWGDEDEEYQLTHNLKETEYWMTHSYLLAFSFTNKIWGLINIDNITDIKFDDTAYDKLVLNAETKQIIKSLVLHGNKASTDIIATKNRGFVFLLHGPPGVGKTTTAEAVSEILHKPLYYISTGELGTDPDDIEQNLTNALNVGKAWNAVVLLDEADVFMEARRDNDIAHNCVVSIFLKLLEYYTGIMFLTTNRIGNFDPAFYSRIKLPIYYPALTTEARGKIWHLNLMQVNPELINHIPELQTYELNGRQIQNIVKTAQVLAIDADAKMDINHIKCIMNVHLQFNDFVKK